MISQRQSLLLKLIVEDYIKTAKQIGSKSLCKIMKCSSATIRNEMSELEELGLLEKTHISSGRIPSEKGYRYYVDNIMKPKELSGDDMLKLSDSIVANTKANEVASQQIAHSYAEGSKNQAYNTSKYQDSIDKLIAINSQEGTKNFNQNKKYYDA